MKRRPILFLLLLVVASLSLAAQCGKDLCAHDEDCDEGQLCLDKGGEPLGESGSGFCTTDENSEVGGELHGMDEQGDWSENCLTDGEGPSEIDILSASVVQATASADVVVEITYDGDAEGSYDGDPTMGANLGMKNGDLLSARLTVGGGSKVESAPSGVSVEHEWSAPNVLRFRFSGIELANVKWALLVTTCDEFRLER